MQSDDPGPIVRARQTSCRHAFIKPPNQVQRCVHCGVSAADWEKMQTEPAPVIWGGNGSP